MKLVGLGGGIGAGKSTVSAQFAARGAVIVDADLIARQVVEPGTPALAAIAERFGADVIDEHGALRRAALAAIVFPDPEALAALNAITHPAINAEIAGQIDAQRRTDRVVILDAALLFDRERPGLVGRIVVDVDPEIAVARLMQFRGFSEADARARIASQMGRAERVAAADFVIDNSGDEAALTLRVAEAWAWIESLPNSAEAGEPEQ